MPNIQANTSGATWCKDIKEYTYTPVHIKLEKWEEVKKDLKSFADVCKIFEVK